MRRLTGHFRGSRVKTIRDHIASHPAVPAPPPGATHALVWEPYGPSRSQWAMVALDDSPDADAALLPGPADLAARELAGRASALLGYPAVLSSRLEVEGEYAYYGTPAGGA